MEILEPLSIRARKVHELSAAEQTNTLAVANSKTVFEPKVAVTLEVLSSAVLEVELLCNGD